MCEQFPLLTQLAMRLTLSCSWIPASVHLVHSHTDKQAFEHRLLQHTITEQFTKVTWRRLHPICGGSLTQCSLSTQQSPPQEGPQSIQPGLHNKAR